MEEYLPYAVRTGSADGHTIARFHLLTTAIWFVNERGDSIPGIPYFVVNTSIRGGEVVFKHEGNT